MTPRLLKQVFGSLLIAVLVLGGATAHLLTAGHCPEKGHSQLLAASAEATTHKSALCSFSDGDEHQTPGLMPVTIQQVLWIQIDLISPPELTPIALEGEREEQRSHPVADAACAKRASAIDPRCGESS